MPQLCFNSPAVMSAVRVRARLIANETERGLRLLKDAGHPELFLGLFAGWETQIGRDAATGKPSGFHALSNKGFSASRLPADIDRERAGVVSEFIDLWTTSLAGAGVPESKIYSHTAFMTKATFEMKRFAQPTTSPETYLETICFTPPTVAIGPHHRPGFSTYPQFGLAEELHLALSKDKISDWASAEGTAVDPGAAEGGSEGGPMERYLGDLFGHGAVVVNLFGWGVGSATNPFRKVVESKGSIAAYVKFLHGDELAMDPPMQLPSSAFFDKLRRLQKKLPTYIQSHGPQRVAVAARELDRCLQTQRFVDAETAVDQLLAVIEG